MNKEIKTLVDDLKDNEQDKGITYKGNFKGELVITLTKIVMQ